MTLKQLATELHTPLKDIRAWLKENNLTERDLDECPGAPTGFLSDDGASVVRHIHLDHTHPEVQHRIDNLIQVIFDQRREIKSLGQEIYLLREGRK